MKMHHTTSFMFLLMSWTFAYADYKELQKEDQLKQAIATNTSGLVVKFATDWCSICEKIAQPFKDIMEDPDFFHIMALQVDVDAFPDLAEEYNIEAIPTFYFFAPGGTLIGTSMGVQNVENFKETFRAELRSKFGAHTKSSSNKHLEQISEKEKSPLTTLATSHDDSVKSETKQNFFSMIGAFFASIFKTLRELFENVINFFKRIF
jgi:thioredoxin 1